MYSVLFLLFNNAVMNAYSLRCNKMTLKLTSYLRTVIPKSIMKCFLLGFVALFTLKTHKPSIRVPPLSAQDRRIVAGKMLSTTSIETKINLSVNSNKKKFVCVMYNQNLSIMHYSYKVCIHKIYEKAKYIIWDAV